MNVLFSGGKERRGGNREGVCIGRNSRKIVCWETGRIVGEGNSELSVLKAINK